MNLEQLRAKLARDVADALDREELIARDGGYCESAVRRYAQELIRLIDQPAPERPDNYREG